MVAIPISSCCAIFFFVVRLSVKNYCCNFGLAMTTFYEINVLSQACSNSSIDDELFTTTTLNIDEERARCLQRKQDDLLSLTEEGAGASDIHRDRTKCSNGPIYLYQTSGLNSSQEYPNVFIVLWIIILIIIILSFSILLKDVMYLTLCITIIMYNKPLNFLQLLYCNFFNWICHIGDTSD